jgi:hypothetical protein
MSSSIRSAITKRANNQSFQPQNPNIQSRVIQPPMNENIQGPGQGPVFQQTNTSTQQAFNLLADKIKNLEKHIIQQQSDENKSYVNEEIFNSFVDEFNSRTEMIANEINELKDLLMKLQTFTMEVNQKLFNQVYSDSNVIADE